MKQNFESSYGYSGRAPGIQSGKDLEQGMLGKPSEAVAAKSFQDYLPYGEAMKKILDSEACVLTDSIRKLKSLVHQKVAPESGFIRVRSALGSSLDIHHGVDLVMEYNGNIVTIDITENSVKISTGAKADIILPAFLDDDGIPTINENIMNDVSDEIARRLLGGPSLR